jgi:predicted DNA-binding transcriptional regulator AlpA
MADAKTLREIRNAPVTPALRVQDVARALGIGRSTVYTIPWLRERAFRPTGARGLRWDAATIELYKALMRNDQADTMKVA